LADYHPTQVSSANAEGESRVPPGTTKRKQRTTARKYPTTCRICKAEFKVTMPIDPEPRLDDPFHPERMFPKDAPIVKSIRNHEESKHEGWQTWNATTRKGGNKKDKLFVEPNGQMLFLTALYIAAEKVPHQPGITYDFVDYYSMFARRFSVGRLYLNKTVPWGQWWKDTTQVRKDELKKQIVELKKQITEEEESKKQITEATEGKQRAFTKSLEKLQESLQEAATKLFNIYENRILFCLRSSQTTVENDFTDQQRVDFLNNCFMVINFICWMGVAPITWKLDPYYHVLNSGKNQAEPQG
jgi:hypothetical protein